MRTFSFLRTTALALALTAALGATTGAFSASAQAADQQPGTDQQQQATNDSPDFMIQDNNIDQTDPDRAYGTVRSFGPVPGVFGRL